MKSNSFGTHIILLFLFTIFFSFLSAQDARTNERSIDPSSISHEVKKKNDTYDFKFEKEIKKIFKEHEGIEDIYSIENDCPRINLKIDFLEAQYQFFDDFQIWIIEKKSKYPKAHDVIINDLNNLN